MTIFREIEQKHQICMESPKTPNSQKTILREKNTAGGLTLPDFKLYYRKMTIKTHSTGRKTDTQTHRTELRAQK